MDLNSILAARNYDANRTVTRPEPDAGSALGQTLGNAASDFAATLQESETIAMQAMTSGADPHALVQALTQTELAVETAVTIRNKVVEAYQEILRMPV
ncbi:flagellar hook-basal body complex protein FliE [Ponticoccus sp. SC2-23]|uniref:flagellar hook-basal body complex protein FliE n=1 Tax=Alexandriicola marinus TaxID=2081710 RepID=UPI000FDAA815|nr:flagellar hook-basal body complex protein FliE [Alexandriicola marinus]MBM1220509.1 flagellar hook-basal body complex protein FliE [Ponticoccus sp. SC6-9]MBM1225195.1 flagellar hook-basal body complex protein FliE [Ponticoccus sp. SC6-15]MBM1228709.1 flagellar hook-basal body complex protein FliE [Ponticoccus sp. SC6-38]MBM1233654.1 flagellar hook-basal body complex protein FliE [Ponticoccus sp. SC6-45]MBM1239210.1 flagellar hook-basal body complex protein FliE [Ponticoccus sp. SC6-49]MBM1